MMDFDSPPSVSCIIPYFNEELRPLTVVSSILKVRGISKVITVDDGSPDERAYKEIKSKFKKVISIKLKTNKGKAYAIKEGLKNTTDQYILLIDGDLTDIKTTELENAIQKITNNPDIDMIILRRTEDKSVSFRNTIRDDIIFSGQRILKRTDLEKVFENNIKGYFLESAINSYMMKHNKKVYWMPFSIHNLHKHHKWGIKDGFFRIGLPGFLRYMTSRNIIMQSLFFCKEEAK